jgi:hypothetical protein
MQNAPVVFVRPRHTAIVRVLQGLDASLLAQWGCYFAGGTAIAMTHGEYRESVDIDFLCASQQGYSELRSNLNFLTLAPLLPLQSAGDSRIQVLREVRADMYGVHTMLGFEDLKIKFEIVFESRIALEGMPSVVLGVPLLSVQDMFAEKLLANADRGLDSSTFDRDMIDLLSLRLVHHNVPQAAWEKARKAYGASVDRALLQGLTRLQNAAWLTRCCTSMAIDGAHQTALQALAGDWLSERLKDAAK